MESASEPMGFWQKNLARVRSRLSDRERRLYMQRWSRPHAPMPMSDWRAVDLLNYLIFRYSFERYLEIGVRQNRTFANIYCRSIEGVDPNFDTTFRMTSDRFFDECRERRARGENVPGWDLIFVDGDHERGQVKRDIVNALEFVRPGGIIVCHDVNPDREYLVGPKWSYSAWEAFADLRCSRSDLFMYVVDAEWCGVIEKGTQTPHVPPAGVDVFNWRYLDANRRSLMNSLTQEEFFARHGMAWAPFRSPR
jgi:hypothetical protein